MNSTSTPAAWLQALAFQGVVPQIVALCVGIPSAFLYAIEVFIMITHWAADYNTPFYFLFIVRAFIVRDLFMN
jgi:hypothetical protein